MTLLIWLTLAYAAILVLALAVGLIMVWLRLRGIDRGLEAAHDSLVRVRDASAGLDDGIEPLRERLLAAIRALQEAAEELAGAEEKVAERSGAAAGGGAG
ncbi:MAG: hypothetical protein KY466_13945 [Gemmatimonadetes bacterium]|nr:hypothetical protein [Gemmatimonadota bacterium]